MRAADPTRAPTPWWQTPRFVAALIVLATVAAYAPVFGAGFIWDDDDYVTQNPLLREASGLWRIWFSPTELPQYYPVVHTTFWLEFRLFGMHAAGYHAVNVLLHAANACLLLGILRRLRVPGATLAAFVFAVHPVHVESVAWITERKNVLSGLFYLLALDRWLRWTDAAGPPPTRHVALAFVHFLAALLSKTVTCSLPAVFLLIAWWRHGRLRRREVLASLPFFAAGLALALVTAALERSHVRAEGAEFAFTVADRLLIAGRAPWFYLGTLFWPVGLSFNHERWVLDPGSLAQWAFPAAAVAAPCLLFALRHRIGRGPLVALLFFGGSLVPALGFFNVFPMRYSFVADHFQYLASLGPIVLLAAIATRTASRTAAGRRLAHAGAAGVVLLLGGLTSQQARIYESLEVLWRDTIGKNPRSWLALTNLASLQLGRGEHAAAIAGLEQALAVHESSETRAVLGIARLQAGDAPGAQRDLERAVAIDPRRNDARAFLGHVLHARGEHERALAELRQALAIREDYDRARAFLGAVLCSLGRHAEAVPHLQRAIDLNPMAVDAFRDMAKALVATGAGDRAVLFAANALQRDPAGTASQDAVVEVFAAVMASWSKDRAGSVIREVLPQVPALRPLAGRLVERLAQKAPAVAEAVRAAFAGQ